MSTHAPSITIRKRSLYEIFMNDRRFSHYQIFMFEEFKKTKHLSFENRLKIIHKLWSNMTNFEKYSFGYSCQDQTKERKEITCRLRIRSKID
jgi:hypothetical protein